MSSTSTLQIFRNGDVIGEVKSSRLLCIWRSNGLTLDWKTFVIAASGPVIALVSLSLSFRSRRPYRELLYSKQIDGCVDLLQALSAWYSEKLAELILQRTRGSGLTDSLRAEKVFIEKFDDWSLLLPSELLDAITQLMQQIELTQKSVEVPVSTVQEAYKDVVGTERRLGIQQLSDDTLRLLTRRRG
jgi:hypothetical protein